VAAVDAATTIEVDVVADKARTTLVPVRHRRGCFLWISGIKMGEKGSVSEIVETGGIIAHAVFEASNEVVVWD
jgi:hypothetical protein